MISALKKIFALVTAKTIPLEGDIGVQLGGKVVAVLGSPQKATAFAEDLSSADVLSIDGKGPKYSERRDKIGYVKFKGRKTFSDNNADILILGENPGTALWSKDAFSKKQWLLMALRPWLVLQLPALLRHIGRNRLIPHCKLALGGQGFLCFEIKCDVLDNHRQFYPLDSTARAFLASINDKNYVLLRGENEIDDLPASADIDLLIESGDIGEIIARNEKKLCTRPMDIYSHDGSNGFYFNRAPYVTPKLAEALLSGKLLKNGIYIAAPEAQFLSDQFHLVFHVKSRNVPKGSEIIKKQDLRSASTFERLEMAAQNAGQPMPQTYSEIEQNLKAAEMFPEIDLLGFYCVKNPFLQHRYLTAGFKPGLATFFIRDFGGAQTEIENISAALASKFDILLEKPLDIEQQKIAVNAIRGGNWADPEAQGGNAPPVYLFVCLDHQPQEPSKRTKRKHPLVDNENNRIKEAIRKQAAPERRKALRMIHGSDNTEEAVAHLQSLALDKTKEIAPHIAALSKS